MLINFEDYLDGGLVPDKEALEPANVDIDLLQSCVLMEGKSYLARSMYLEKFREHAEQILEEAGLSGYRFELCADSLRDGLLAEGVFMDSLQSKEPVEMFRCTARDGEYSYLLRALARLNSRNDEIMVVASLFRAAGDHAEFYNPSSGWVQVEAPDMPRIQGLFRDSPLQGN